MEKIRQIQRENNLNEIFYLGQKQEFSGAFHQYEIRRNGVVLCQIQFQDGPRGDQNSIPGVFDSDLLEIVRHRLECFQSGNMACRENEKTLSHVEEALFHQAKRAYDRADRKVLGTTEK